MRRFRRALVTALVAHAVLIAVVSRVRRVPSVQPPRPVELEVSIESAPPPASRTALPPPPGEPVAPGPSTHARAIAAHASSSPADRAVPHAEAPSAEDARATPEPSASPAASTWSVGNLVSRPVNLAPSTTDKYGPAPESEAARAKESASAREAVQATLEANDVALGITRGGAAVAVAIDETRSSTAPVDGWAIFEIIVGIAGQVVDVKVVDVSEDRASWDTVARAMLADLASKPFRLPPRARGLIARVRVDSRWQYPNGVSARGRQLPAALKAITLPLTFALGSDPTSSAKPTRAVTARILEETPIWM